MSSEEATKVPPRKRPATKFLALRLSPLQKATLQKQSVRLGYKTLTHMIRAVADEMEKTPPLPPPVWPPVPREIRFVTIQLQQIGHLINQMARALNSKVFRSEPLLEADLKALDANLGVIVGFLDAISRNCERIYENQGK